MTTMEQFRSSAVADGLALEEYRLSDGTVVCIGAHRGEWVHPERIYCALDDVEYRYDTLGEYVAESRLIDTAAHGARLR